MRGRMSYTFIPLRDYPQSGVVLPNYGKPRAAEFLTPAEAKNLAARKAQRG
jgi:hypothetical protein